MKSDAFACIMTDIENHRVVDVARGRTEKGAEAVITHTLLANSCGNCWQKHSPHFGWR